MAQFHLDPVTYGWYRDLRRYGTVPHAGFSLGFERLLVYVCGLSNASAMPFPTPAPREHAEFWYPARHASTPCRRHRPAFRRAARRLPQRQGADPAQPAAAHRGQRQRR